MVTCTHMATGAKVQTANPEVLGAEFACPSPKITPRSAAKPQFDGGSISNNGTLRFLNSCGGANYFFAFGPADSSEISVTRYFEVVNDGQRYGNPKITVYYSRLRNDSSQSVQKVSKKGL